MKFGQLFAAGSIVVGALSGCTTAVPLDVEPSPSVTPQGSTATASRPSRELAGTLVSQAAPTTGTVLLSVAPDSIILTLTDFSTAAGDNLYINLNTEPMTRNAAGDNVVDSPIQYQVAALKSLSGTQSYDLSYMINGMPEDVQSITIYSYSSLEAFGTANLEER